MNAKEWCEDFLACKDCMPNFDGKGGFRFCEKHWGRLTRIIKQQQENQRWKVEV